MNSYFYKNRLIFFLIICILSIGALLYAYASLALKPTAQIRRKPETAERGSIVDRTGFALAVQANFYNIGVNPRQALIKQGFAKNIASVLDMSEAEITAILTSTKKSFIYLKKHVDENTYKIVKEEANKNGYNFISYEKIPGRIYPNHSLAAHLVGFMGTDGKGPLENRAGAVCIGDPDDLRRGRGGARSPRGPRGGGSGDSSASRS